MTISNSTLNYELRNWLRGELNDILELAQEGRCYYDNIIDELGDYFDEVQSSDDAVLILAYDSVRGIDEDENNDTAMTIVKRAIAAIS